jgi:hypothetical protein
VDLTPELPYGPAAYERPQQRPDTWQHPITRHSSPKISLAPGGAFSNRASCVNGFSLYPLAWSGSRFSPRSACAAATSGPKHRRCNVHNGLTQKRRGPTPSLAAGLYPRPGGQLVPAQACDARGSRQGFSAAHWLFRPAEGLARAPDAVQDHRQLSGQRNSGFANAGSLGDCLCPVFQA